MVTGKVVVYQANPSAPIHLGKTLGIWQIC